MLKRFFFLILSIYASYAVSASEDVLSRAQTLLEAGNARAAYRLLRPLEDNLAGEAYFDYLLGLSALDSNNALDAVFALEPVVDLNPEHGPARAELARAYLALGETDDAQAEFQKVQEMDVPPEAKQTIERYMSNIELFHDATRTRFRPWVLTGLGYDTNVNGATDTNGPVAIPIAPGVPFLFGGAENSPIWQVGAGVRVTSPLDIERGLTLVGRIGVDQRLVLDEADFSSLIGDGQLGLKVNSRIQHF